MATHWVCAGERARPGCRFRRRAENPFPKLICPTMFRARRPKLHARRTLSPRSSNPNCLWPGLCRRPPWRTATHWVIAGERARPGCRFRRRAKNRFPNGMVPPMVRAHGQPLPPATCVRRYDFPARALPCRWMMFASARRESFTAPALGKALATSGSKTTTFVPRW